MDYNTALNIANNLIEELRPYCEMISIAGSIRRKKPEVKDIEIVCIPKRQKHHRTGKQVTQMGFINAVNKYPKRKGDAFGKYTQRWIPWGDGGIVLDLFTATYDNWGLILAIRTGSADYSHLVLATGWTKKRMHSKEGTLYLGHTEIKVPNEETLFRLIDIPFCIPERREV